MVRALRRHRRGHWFKSSIAHQIILFKPFRAKRPLSIPGFLKIGRREIIKRLFANHGDIRINKIRLLISTHKFSIYFFRHFPINRWSVLKWPFLVTAGYLSHIAAIPIPPPIHIVCSPLPRSLSIIS